MMSCYSGMMSAMEEIQARADGIMENIMQKEGELAEIQQQAREAEREKQTLEADMRALLGDVSQYAKKTPTSTFSSSKATTGALT